MAIKLTELPYEKEALEPHMSKETLEFHHDKHQKKYVTTLNELIKGTDYEDCDLEEIIQDSYENAHEAAIFNNAAQVWNHEFFWKCLTPRGGIGPESAISGILEKDFGSVDAFQKQFTETAVKLFGSGWAWLTLNESGKLTIEGKSNAGTPIAQGFKPLLTCDVWEHAYYIDYRNERPKFIDAFWKLVNWDFVTQQLEIAKSSTMSAAKGEGSSAANPGTLSH